jgi:hypothetical protein
MSRIGFAGETPLLRRGCTRPAHARLIKCKRGFSSADLNQGTPEFRYWQRPPLAGGRAKLAATGEFTSRLAYNLYIQKRNTKDH